MSPAAEALLRKEESLQMGQAERFGALGGAQSQTEAFSKESQSPGGRSLCSGCGPESCWVLQEGCLVASHPVLQKLPRLVSPPSPRCCPSLITPNEWLFVHERKATCMCL